MTRLVSLFEFMPYGAPELQSVARAYLLRALLLASLLCALAILGAGIAARTLGVRGAPPPPTVVTIESWRDVLPPPPSIAPPPPRVAVARRPSTAGIAVPVPGRAAPPDVDLFDQRDAPPGPATPPGPGRDAIVEPPVETPPAYGTYVYVDELPVPVRQVTPPYPELAKAAGVEGLVLAHALVGKDGSVLDARVDDAHSIPMLDGAALDALRQWRFRPGNVNGHPVACWVAVPFNFRLH